MAVEKTLPLSYRSLTRVPGLPRLMLAALLGRTGVQMMSVALVLYALGRFHSPAVAGAAIFAAIFPGIVVSPLTGSALDRWGRIPLVALDYSIGAASLGLIVALGQARLLSAGLLIAIAAVSSLTWPLSTAGTRTLFPQVVPRSLWDRANAIDSATYVLAIVIGAPVAAGVAGTAGRPAAVAATAAVFAAAAISLVAMPPLPRSGAAPAAFFRGAWQGLAYLIRNPTLRGLAISMSVYNLAQGVILVALPVLILDRFHLNAALVGVMWALVGIAEGVAAIAIGRRSSEGRERRIISRSMLVAGLVACGLLVTAALWAALPAGAGLALTATAALVYGAAGGPMNVAMFTLRQRRTEPAWFGRVFAISMSLNYVGMPIGSALAGALLVPGVALGFAAAAAFAVAGGVIVLLTIPAAAECSETSALDRAV